MREVGREVTPLYPGSLKYKIDPDVAQVMLERLAESTALEAPGSQHRLDQPPRTSDISSDTGGGADMLSTYRHGPTAPERRHAQ